jgi:hypothetical protein
VGLTRLGGTTPRDQFDKLGQLMGIASFAKAAV